MPGETNTETGLAGKKSVETVKAVSIIGPGHAKTCLMPYANNKGADQPAHLRSLISTFVVRCLDSMICILAISSFKILTSFCSCSG